jgi:hypothetical protein
MTKILNVFLVYSTGITCSRRLNCLSLVALTYEAPRHAIFTYVAVYHTLRGIRTVLNEIQLNKAKKN